MASAEFCYVSGLGHYRTFDGHLYNFPGKCPYRLVESKAPHPKFSIIAKNQKCDYNEGFCSKSLYLTVGSEKYSLVKGKKPAALSPALRAMGFSRSVQHFDTVLSSPKLGLTVLWSADLRVSVYLHSNYSSKVTGMCGNADGVRQNDLNVSCPFIRPPSVFSKLTSIGRE